MSIIFHCDDLMSIKRNEVFHLVAHSQRVRDGEKVKNLVGRTGGSVCASLWQKKDSHLYFLASYLPILLDGDYIYIGVMV